MSGRDLPDMVERIELNRRSASFAYVAIRLPDVNLRGIEARRDSAGRVTLTPPTQEDRNGRRWPLFALQPGTAEAAADAVARVWRRAEGSV